MPKRRTRDRRQSARNDARVEVRVSGPDGGGRALLSDLSYTGARLEACAWMPPVGSTVRLTLEVAGVGKLELDGCARRCFETGFALAFDPGEPPPREQVDRVTALLFAASTDPSRD